MDVPHFICSPVGDVTARSCMWLAPCQAASSKVNGAPLRYKNEDDGRTYGYPCTSHCKVKIITVLHVIDKLPSARHLH